MNRQEAIAHVQQLSDQVRGEFCCSHEEENVLDQETAEALKVLQTPNEEALMDFVRQTMGSGVAWFTDNISAIRAMDPKMPFHHAFTEEAKGFLSMRKDLIEALYS